jgi:hypothetical protein
MAKKNEGGMWIITEKGNIWVRNVEFALGVEYYKF